MLRIRRRRDGRHFRSATPGKTQLVQHSLSDRDDTVVYQATETTSQIQLDEFVDVASETFLVSHRLNRTGKRYSDISVTKTES